MQAKRRKGGATGVLYIRRSSLTVVFREPTRAAEELSTTPLENVTLERGSRIHDFCGSRRHRRHRGRE